MKDAFAKVGGPTDYRAVWGHQGAMNSLLLDPKHVGYGRPRRGRKSLSIFERYSSNLLVAERPHLSTECVVATQVEKPVLTTAFWELRLKDPSYAPVFLLWVNSTFGLIHFLSRATSSQGDIFKMKKEQLHDLKVPNPDRINMNKWKAFLDEVGNEKLNVYREEFAQAARGIGVRHEIDQFIAAELGLGAPSPTVYELLAREPMMSKRRL